MVNGYKNKFLQLVYDQTKCFKSLSPLFIGWPHGLSNGNFLREFSQGARVIYCRQSFILFPYLFIRQMLPGSYHAGHCTRGTNQANSLTSQN